LLDALELLRRGYWSNTTIYNSIARKVLLKHLVKVFLEIACNLIGCVVDDEFKEVVALVPAGLEVEVSNVLYGSFNVLRRAIKWLIEEPMPELKDQPMEIGVFHAETQGQILRVRPYIKMQEIPQRVSERWINVICLDEALDGP
jgi:hypothetical protein